MSREKFWVEIETQIQSRNIKDIKEGFADAGPNDLVFYNLNDGEKSLSDFEQRSKNKLFAFLVTIERTGVAYPQNCLAVKMQDFLWLQEKSVQKILRHELTGKKFIGITGTNGKTTTVHIIRTILANEGVRVLSIGTVGIWLGNQCVGNTNTMTSPGYITFHRILAQWQDKFDVLVMEVSSHALDQGRIRGLKFNYAAWMSFTQDHLDYHGSMENYFNTKIKLVTDYLKKDAKFYVPWREKELFERINSVFSCVIPKKLESSPGQLLPPFFQIDFNQSNLETAIAICEDYLARKVSVDVHKLTTPEGRLEIHRFGQKTFVIDSAHTPGALENVCRAINQAFPDKDLFVLFGCGGDRDRNKRPIMAKVVSSFAKKIFLTLDNVRNEDPQQIIADILPGIDKSKTQVEMNREKAVELAYNQSHESTVVLLAGKGPEQYQIVKGQLVPYSELGSLKMAHNKVTRDA